MKGLVLLKFVCFLCHHHGDQCLLKLGSLTCLCNVKVSLVAVTEFVIAKKTKQKKKQEKT